LLANGLSKEVAEGGSQSIEIVEADIAEPASHISIP
jgi:hypothetical protein